ncbi:MAG: NAD(P)-dependent oxidoreductase [Deltaproteobacteria bacterium]|nr:NAD(P)-dependent oxidoreductase [Deltaproteobacteria bacterium]
MKRLQNKNILLTAAAQGIGHASLLRFLEEGATVWATDINLKPLEALHYSEQQLKVRKLDVCDPGAITKLTEEIGTIDVLFNCAGFVHSGTILECTENDWDMAFEINVRSMYRLAKITIPRMVSNGSGVIINMASVASSVKGVPNRFVYGTSKAAVIGLTKAIAADFVSQGIRCNAICPGTVETPSLNERMVAQGGDLEQVRSAFVARQPMGRIGTPEEIANLAVYLSSDESSYTTGAVFAIDGGMTI